MSKINLLPWREKRRNRRNKWFFIILAGVSLLGIMIVMLMEALINHRIEIENANIAYINNELKDIKAEIFEVKMLQENKKQIIKRMNIIQQLEKDRTSIVRFLDMVPRVLPGNIHLTELSRKEEATETINEAIDSEVFQKRYAIYMQGIALTNGGVSALLKNLEGIKWLSELKLNEVLMNKNGEGLNFKISLIQNLTE